MQLVCISRGSRAYGEEVATKLAQRLGFSCISREEITNAASEQGIPVGKLEVEIMKHRPLSEEMAIQMDLLKAFVSATLCQRALEGTGAVYHGRTGHLVLPTVSHVLRVRTIADMESRVRAIMGRMGFTADKARQYIEQVDDDHRRWVRALYQENWEDPALYDVTVNASHLSEENAATALSRFLDLPEFQPTPSSRQALSNLLLASQCRLTLGLDDRTRHVKVTVRADRGHVSVTYLPRQARAAEAIPAVLGGEPGIASILRTVATTNILYIAERFDPEAKDLDHLIALSDKWNAAIELVRIRGEEEADDGSPAVAHEPDHAAGTDVTTHGGIMDDDPTPAPGAGAGHGIPETMDRLVQAGRAGGCRELTGGADLVSTQLPDKENYSLVVVGDVFSRKEGAQQRMKRDFLSLLSERFRVPVLGAEDLKARYLFGLRQLVDLVVLGAVSCVLYFLVFRFQEPILTFLSSGHFEGGVSRKITASLSVALFVPVVAFVVGGLYRNLLKLIKME